MSEETEIFGKIRRKEESDSTKTVAPIKSTQIDDSKGSQITSRSALSSDRQNKVERAQKCLENAALVSKRIKEHRKATAELLGRHFEDDEGGDAASELASTVSTGYSAAASTSTLSVQEALNIPGISESLANTLKQKEILMQRIKQYKEISKKPISKSSTLSRRESYYSKEQGGTDAKKSIDISDVSHLQNVKDKENIISVLQVKVKALEATVMDLQEKITEKDIVIQAKTKATSLMSDNLSKKEKDSILLLEDTRQQMIKMQENFIIMENDWKEERKRLVNEIDTKDVKIKNLEEANKILENSRFEISVANSKISEELNNKNKEIINLQQKLEDLMYSEVNTGLSKNDEEKGSLEIAEMVEMSKRIEILEQLNCQIRQTNIELEQKLATFETKALTGSSPIKSSPVTPRKGKRTTTVKAKSPWSTFSETSTCHLEKKDNKSDVTKVDTFVQSLNKDILDKEIIISQKDNLIKELQESKLVQDTAIKELENRISQSADIENREIEQAEKSQMLDVSTETCFENVESIVDRTQITSDKLEKDSLLSPEESQIKLKMMQDQIAILTSDLEAANKNMIKIKSAHKLKIKQMQKTIDSFSKMSDTNAELLKFNDEVHRLTQRVAELEEEKGNLQLHLVDYDSGRLTETEAYRKMVEMETLAESRLRAISELETQKFDLVQELHLLQQNNTDLEDKLADLTHLQNEQVCSEIKSVQLEEQVDALTVSKNTLELLIEDLKKQRAEMELSNETLQNDKEILSQKLEQYIQENMELTDRLEKLSAEKVSSAESIEIVDPFTTQEKLELEEYNKNVLAPQLVEPHSECVECHHELDNANINEELLKLSEESAELNKRIELFTQERKEVMEKMAQINLENEALQRTMSVLTDQTNILQNTIDVLTTEKNHLQMLNTDLNQQIESLKRENIEILKETCNLSKPACVEDISHDIQPEEKSQTEKIDNKGRTIKQLTKEILKLKNIIKEREAEIADSQMKILSLEEQHQKHVELSHTNAMYEVELKDLTNERNQLREELSSLVHMRNMEFKEVIDHLKSNNEALLAEINRVQDDHKTLITTRDERIKDLENLVIEYEKQMHTYNNSLQQKDKELTEYINQLTKLNDVSQKLRSTVQLLEEEKANDQNAELLKSLNKQIAMYQKTFAEYEEKLGLLENDKAELLNIKTSLETRISTLESETNKLSDNLFEKQTLINELQQCQKNHENEILIVNTKCKERDEEMHEIKLQLRKESIENEMLRNKLEEEEKAKNKVYIELEEIKGKLVEDGLQKDEASKQQNNLETKNKELLEKLKKYAVNLKRKSNTCIELEGQLAETKNRLELKNQEIACLMKDAEKVFVMTNLITNLENKLKDIGTEKVVLEENSLKDIKHLQDELRLLHESLFDLTTKNSELLSKNVDLETQVDTLNKKIVEYELEQKNYSNYEMKISNLEADIYQKQLFINDLVNNLQKIEENYKMLMCSHDAKMQEKDLYVESLETEISKFKNRICRLEESVSVMEERRHSLERKADQLDTQFIDKQKAYSEYMTQEDELVNRLAVLIDHDAVVEKQLNVIENENKELKFKIQNLSEENQNLRDAFLKMQNECQFLKESANNTMLYEIELNNCHQKIRELESQLNKINKEHQIVITKKDQEIEILESDFNKQIENAIKEKKILNEKCERMTETITHLEHKIEEYTDNICNLNINLEEMSKLNNNLMDKSKYHEAIQSDYTEQYINEINKMRSTIDAQDAEINKLTSNYQSIQTEMHTIIPIKDHQLVDLKDQVEKLKLDNANLKMQLDATLSEEATLKSTLDQKNEQLRYLIENKTMTIEMNIPKTEGMFISSTIEGLSEDMVPKSYDITSIQSQILTEPNEPTYNLQSEHMIRAFEHDKSQPVSSGLFKSTDPKHDTEMIIVPKQSYLCYENSNDSNKPSGLIECDPFNSEEGWGLNDDGDFGEVVPGFSRFKDQINQLKKENEALKKDLESSTSKLMKAMKKLKELKINNDILSKEIKVSKQLSQAVSLDTTIEDELRSYIKDLENKMAEIETNLNKEKQEKEKIKKQNEVFCNANDKLAEMKEKLDNEIELWKFKFKEANDKMSTLQWGIEQTQQSSGTTTLIQNDDKCNLLVKYEIEKLEKENDELQSLVDQFRNENKDLLHIQSQLKEEIAVNKIDSEKFVCQLCEMLRKDMMKLQKNNEELKKEISDLTSTLKNIRDSYDSVSLNYDIIKMENVKLKSEFSNKEHSLSNDASVLLDKYNILRTEYETLKVQNEQVKTDLNSSLNKITSLESYVEEVNRQLTECQTQYDEAVVKLRKLNEENSNLFSTVAELRSSISNAVDQRGSEVAEMWKQHLNQRESDFATVEQELKAQVIALECKYEELLNNVQSSSQEETNKLIIVEQLNIMQNKLKEKEEKLCSLQNKYGEFLNENSILRSEIEDEKIMNENKLLRQQDEYEKQISDMLGKHKDNMQLIDGLESDLACLNKNCTHLNDENIKLKETVFEMENRLSDLSNKMRLTDDAIFMKSQEYNITLSQRNDELEKARKQIFDYEKIIEELNYEKESELAHLRLKMHEISTHHEANRNGYEKEKLEILQTLENKIEESKRNNNEILNLQKCLDVNKVQMAEMQTVLEAQELEIVTLKDEISSLEELLRMSSMKSEKHVTFASDTKPGPDDLPSVQSSLQKDLLDPVPRAELDLALYMLHQRDVRCEELTMELTQLLEERDTLQLRLSDCLRMFEDIKSKYRSAGLDISSTTASHSTTELQGVNIKDAHFVDTHKVHSSRSGSVTDVDGDKGNLQAKLSELRSVKHSRDVTFRQDSEQRQLDLRLLQRDVANLPEEAAEQLRQAHHTLSRDTQSTSTVLLNWLRGKSTPKVVHM